MSQCTARVPDEIIEELDKAARSLHRTRAQIGRQAIELYLEDYHDLSTAIDALRDPADEVLEWELTGGSELESLLVAAAIIESPGRCLVLVGPRLRIVAVDQPAAHTGRRARIDGSRAGL